MNTSELMQWIAIARRHPLSVMCASVCIVCVATCWLISRDLKWLDLEHKQSLQDAELAQSTLISGPSVKQERLAALSITRQIEENLVVEDNLAENLQYFYKIEDRTHAHVMELKPLNALMADTRALYRRIPFSVRVTGTYEQAVAFLYGVETGPRLANIASVTVRRRDPASMMLILDLNVELLGRK
jgi:Tfp pilus assembly protein PilO